MSEGAEQVCADKLQVAIDALASALTANDPMLRQNVRWALVNVGEDALEALVRTLEHESANARWEAAKALGEIGSAEGASALVAALDDKVFDVRWVAGDSLIALGRPALAPLLEALIDKPTSARLREGAHHVLRVLGETGLGDLVAPVLSALGRSKGAPDIVSAATEALDALPDEQQDAGS